MTRRQEKKIIIRCRAAVEREMPATPGGTLPPPVRPQSESPASMTAPSFATLLLRWHRQHGRHDLPWQNTRDPYRVWLSEIMLQQTQVASVIPYYRRFLDRYPTLPDLAAAPVDAVMELWSGLGYYARARNLHRCAQVVMSEHGGAFPRNADVIATLPGIGRSTANAIAVFCFGARVPILDGNVKRVLCRAYGIEGFPGTPKRCCRKRTSMFTSRRKWTSAPRSARGLGHAAMPVRWPRIASPAAMAAPPNCPR